MLGDCTFFGNDKIRDRTIWRSDIVQIFPSNTPIVPGHMLICPIRCIATAEMLTDDERTALFDAMAMVKPALARIFASEGFNVAWNEGAVAEQTVAHLHIHLLPRKATDTGITRYEPREFLYRPGSRATTPQAELVDVARLVRDAL